MKKVMFLLAFAVVSVTAFSQDDEDTRNRDYNDDDIRTLVGRSKSVGGYGSLSMQYTKIDERDAFVFGAKGGIMLGHLVSLGLAGSGFFNDIQYSPELGADISLAGGYGGFYFEPVLLPKFPVHVAFPVLIGVGGVSVVNVEEEDFWEDTFSSDVSDAFMVIEPGVEVEMNVTRFFRFCIGGYYRYTSDVDIEFPSIYEVPNDILKGFSAGVSFKFGRF